MRQAMPPADQPYATDYGTPAAPPAAPPADQPYATDYGTPAGAGADNEMDAAAAGEDARAAIFDARTPGPDDLSVLEGIGPKAQEALTGAGIRTFAELAETDVDRLRQILQAADLRLLDPGTWPEQARLAAAGQTEELQALMSRLRGGRRVEG
jgi:predicted flap endonuclease-1-like 5' DNA nuclease